MKNLKFIFFFLFFGFSWAHKPKNNLIDELYPGSVQTISNSRTHSSEYKYFNGNEWYLRLNAFGSWGSRDPIGQSGGLWPRGSNNSVIYSAGLWVTFEDDQGQKRLSGSRFLSDFVQGPYGSNNNSSEANRVFKVNYWDDINSSDWQEWPVDHGAPYLDLDFDGVYDPAVDMPGLNMFSQTLYSVYNDSTLEDGTTSGFFGEYSDGINGIEVHQTIFGGVAFPDELNSVIFIKYDIINKGQFNWNGARFGIWSDVDLGVSTNDAIGVDVDRNMVYAYSTEPGMDYDVFGSDPAVGFRYLSGLNTLQDNIHSGGCMGDDCTGGAGGNYDNPQSIDAVYNRFNGLQNSGELITDPTNGETTKFVSSGDPVSGSGWLDSTPQDKMMYFSVAPIDDAPVPPGDTVSFLMAIDIQKGGDNLASISELRQNIDVIKSISDNNFASVSRVDRSILESTENFGLISGLEFPPVGPSETTQLTRTFRNGGNVNLQLGMEFLNSEFSVSPENITISPGESAELTFLYTAPSYNVNTFQVPENESSINQAIQNARSTLLESQFSIIDNDDFNMGPDDGIYHTMNVSQFGDTVLVSPGYYNENIYIDKSIELLASSNDPIETTIDGNSTGKVIDVDINFGKFTLEGFTIKNGSGDYDGVAMRILGGKIDIKNNIFKDNYDPGSGAFGGAIYSWYASGDITNNTFSQNSAAYGSVVRLNQGAINFYNNTLFDNSTNTFGNVYVRNTNHRIINNIIWNPYSPEDFQAIQLNDNPTVEYNIIRNGFDGLGNLNVDPNFVYLGIDKDFGELFPYKIYSNSIALNSGDPDLDNDGVTYEFDSDDQDADGSRLDIGAKHDIVTTMSDARNLPLESFITLAGVVTTQDRGNVGSIAHTVQNETGAISFYIEESALELEVGDFILISGNLGEYGDNLHIYPEDDSQIEVRSKDLPLPEIKTLTLENYLNNISAYEAELIRFNNVKVISEIPSNPTSSYNIYITDEYGVLSTQMRVNDDYSLFDMELPSQPFSVSGRSWTNDEGRITPNYFKEFSLTLDPGFESSFLFDNSWQRRPYHWTFWPEVDWPSFQIEREGNNIYQSEQIFFPYEGGYSLKMWGNYNGESNMEGFITQNFMEENGNSIKPGSRLKGKAFFMTHEDDGIMEGINVYLYAQLWRDDWQFISRELSTSFNSNYTANQWHPIELEFDVPQDADIVQFGVLFIQPDDNHHGSVYVDNIELYTQESFSLSASNENIVHGDTALVEISWFSNLIEEIQSIDISFSGFQNNLIFNSIVTDGYRLGELDWLIEANDTENLLITASAGAEALGGEGILFAIELIVPDTLSSQNIPINIDDFLVNGTLNEGSVSSGNVQVVWEPIANFSSDITSGYLPLVINFSSESQIGTYPLIETEWHFGDDSIAYGNEVQHTYLNEGEYTVTLIVKDEFGLSDTLIMNNYINAIFPISPEAGYTASVTSGSYPLEVQFIDTSISGTYPITDWSWEFGNDSIGSGINVSTFYEKPGEFDVTLLVTDQYGLMDTVSIQNYIQIDTLYGDIDFNSFTQSLDAAHILQYLSEMITFDDLQIQIADVTMDGTISTLDASIILQYVVNLIDELPYLPGEQFSATGDLSMEDQGAEPNSTIEIPININNGSNIYGFQGELNYDPNVVAIDTVLFSDYLAEYFIIANQISPGLLKISAAGSIPDGETGIFATLIVNLSSDFTDQTSISFTNFKWNEEDLNPVAAEMVITQGLNTDEIQIPKVFALHQNYPNPFNPTTKISYDLPEESLVTLSIYDLMGRKVRTLVDGEQAIGFKNIQWNATNDNDQPVPAGMYIYTIQAGEFRQTKKMVLLK